MLAGMKKKLQTFGKRQKIVAAVVAVVASALVGIICIAITRAATYAVPAEVENGSLSGSASVVSDPRASQGKAVVFKAPAVPPPSPTPAPPPTTPNSRSIKSQPLYVYKPTDWQGRPAAIYDYQVGKWFGNWSSNIQSDVNGLVSLGAAAGKLPLLVAYNIPGRDCGSYSSGGAGNSANYRTWIQNFAKGIGNRKAIVILEPDALAQLDCLNGGDQNARVADLAFAVDIFRNTTQASVYIDGGNVGWKSAADMAGRLKRANVASAAGFSTNVSNFKFTDDSATYGDQIVGLLKQQGVNDARYVIDTSRNGRGPANTGALAWCNPAGRGLGKRPTTSPNVGTSSDAFLWIKTTGESDGPCERGEPAAGQWFPSYAQMLINNAVY